MIDINDKFLEQLVDSFSIDRYKKISLLRRGFDLGKEINNRFIVFISSCDIQTIESGIEYINRTQKTNLVKKKYIVFILRDFNNNIENNLLKEIIKKIITPDLYIVDASTIVLNKNILREYFYNMINYEDLLKEGSADIDKYKEKAESIILDWINEVKENDIFYYDIDNIDGIKCENYSKVVKLLEDVNKKNYPLYPEQLDLPLGLKNLYNIDKYALYGIMLKEDIFEEGIVENEKPSKIFSSIWNDEGICKNKLDNSYISILKKYVDDFIYDRINKNGRVSGVDLMIYLSKYPYGFVSCKLSAYIMGIILRSYLGKDYYYTDGVVYEKLNKVYLESFIINALKKISAYMPSLKDSYICFIDTKILEFIDLTKKIFDISDNVSSIENLKFKLKEKLEKLKYPLWCLNYVDISDDAKMIYKMYMSIINPVAIDNIENNIDDNIYILITY